MPDPARAWRSTEKDEAEEGSGTSWNHKWNVETPGPWGKVYPTAHLQPEVVDRYCTNNLEGSCHKTHSKKGKRQVGSFQLPPDQSARLCWKAGEDHQQKAHMASWVKLSSGFNTNRRSTIPKHRRPTGSPDTGHERCLPREEEGSGSFLWPVKGLQLRKLLHAGVHGKMYKWLSDFLFNRTARVKVDGMISRQVKLREGVPQGFVVLPIHFLVYMNDITTTVPRHVSNTLHVDDFAVWCAEEHTTTAVHHIQNTTNEVCSWTESWALQLNTASTVNTLFSLSTAKEKVSLKLNNRPIPQVKTPKFLGVTLDTHLTCHQPEDLAQSSHWTQKKKIQWPSHWVLQCSAMGSHAVWSWKGCLRTNQFWQFWLYLKTLLCLSENWKSARKRNKHTESDNLCTCVCELYLKPFF